MVLTAPLRPLRSLVFPFTVVLFPLLWFVNRQMGIVTATTDQSTTAIWLQAAESAAVAVVVSFLVAVIIVVVTRAIWGDSMPPWALFLLRPSDGALALFATISTGLGAFIIAGTLGTLPRWLTTVSAPIGWVVGWPLIVIYGGMVLVGNAFNGQPPLAVQFLIVGVGVAFTVGWLFLLSGWIAARVVPGGPERSTT